MNKIEVKVLNPEVIKESEKTMVMAARLTQRGETIKNIDDLIALYNKPYTENTAKNMIELPHPTIQKFGVINLVIVGASRRFLAQITRHQNEVKFMSSSLQYSIYTENNDYVVPYEILTGSKEVKDQYINSCNDSMKQYLDLINKGIPHDEASYVLPQGLRTVILISATPYQLKHMIQQRVCNRNTTETQYVMLKVWQALYKYNPIMFSNCGPFCANGGCKERNMSCGKLLSNNPCEILEDKFKGVL